MIQITSDNIEISASMKELATEKLSRIQSRIKNLPEDLVDIRVVLNSAPNDAFLAKLQLSLADNRYVAEEMEYTLESALVAAVEEIDRQMEKDKGKYEKGWEEIREMKELGEELLEEDLEEDTEEDML